MIKRGLKLRVRTVAKGFVLAVLAVAHGVVFLFCDLDFYRSKA